MFHEVRSEPEAFLFTPIPSIRGTKVALACADSRSIHLIMTDNPERPVGFKEIIGIASCAFGLGLVCFGYGIGTESPKKEAVVKVRAEDAKNSKRPVQAMNLALGDMVFFARDLGFLVRNAKGDTVDASRVAARIESQLTRIRDLYRQEVTKSPALAGGLVLQFNISPNGEVSQIRELSSRLVDGEFKKTVADEASKWSFGEIVTEDLQVTCPLLFVHQGMDITTLVQWEKSLGNSIDKPVLARSAAGPAGQQPADTTRNNVATRSAPRVQVSALKPDVKEFQIKYATALRKDPDFFSPSLTTLTIGTRVTVLRRQSEWVEVRSTANGQTGFIRKEFVAPVEVARH